MNESDREEAQKILGKLGFLFPSPMDLETIGAMVEENARLTAERDRLRDELAEVTRLSKDYIDMAHAANDRLRAAIRLEGEDTEFYFLSDPECRLFVNLNDTFGYAVADAEPIPWDEFDAVIAEWRRDPRTLLAWAAKKRGLDIDALIKDRLVPPSTREALKGVGRV